MYSLPRSFRTSLLLKFYCLLLIQGIWLLAPYAVSAENTPDASFSYLTNFEKVADGFWRGAEPSDRALEQLAHNGVKTIIDLRVVGTEHEREMASKLGITYYHIPMGFWPPPNEKMTQILNLVTDAKSQPVYLHCVQGADRTGMMVGLYRMIVDHWSFDKTWEEMRMHHFKPWLYAMKNQVENFATINLIATKPNTVNAIP